MTLRAMLVTAILGGIVSAAGSTTGERPLAVCMPLGSDLQPLRAAQKLADHMFAEVGVKLEWRKKGLCTEDDIVVTLSYKTPDDQALGGWAYALPYEGTHIVVFWDRIQQKMPPARAPILLAHVLAHEITHILQGTVRHSESGLMKAVWTSTDLFEMGRKPLPFTQADVQLIHRGLEARRAGLSSNGKGLASSAR